MNFLNFGMDSTEKQGIINLSRYRSKNYAYVVLTDSEATFLEEGKDETIRIFLFGLLFIIFTNSSARAEYDTR